MIEVENRCELRMPLFFLAGRVIRNGGAFVDLAGLGDGAAGMQEPLGQLRLASPAWPHKTYVTNVAGTVGHISFLSYIGFLQ